jgi:protocatechuate 3,4-dioxygenase alpha subunit
MPLTPSQTVGPFFHLAIPRPGEELVVPTETPGGFWLRGRVFDGASNPVPDALIETWQAGPDGRFPDSSDTVHIPGLGRSATDDDGGYAIFTTKPGPKPGPNGAVDAPHLDVLVFARGLLRHLWTRIYFPDETVANTRDPLLASLGDDPRRATLIAAPGSDGYTFDVRLQGDGETVFFEF